MIQIVTSSNRRYAEKIMPYLAGLSKLSKFDNVLVQVGAKWSLNLTNVRTVYLPAALNDGAPPETECARSKRPGRRFRWVGSLADPTISAKAFGLSIFGKGCIPEYGSGT